MPGFDWEHLAGGERGMFSQAVNRSWTALNTSAVDEFPTRSRPAGSGVVGATQASSAAAAIVRRFSTSASAIGRSRVDDSLGGESLLGYGIQSSTLRTPQREDFDDGRAPSSFADAAPRTSAPLQPISTQSAASRNARGYPAAAQRRGSGAALAAAPAFEAFKAAPHSLPPADVKDLARSIARGAAAAAAAEAELALRQMTAHARRFRGEEEGGDEGGAGAAAAAAAARRGPTLHGELMRLVLGQGGPHEAIPLREDAFAALEEVRVARLLDADEARYGGLAPASLRGGGGGGHQQHGGSSPLSLAAVAVRALTPHHSRSSRQPLDASSEHRAASRYAGAFVSPLPEARPASPQPLRVELMHTAGRGRVGPLDASQVQPRWQAQADYTSATSGVRGEGGRALSAVPAAVSGRASRLPRDTSPEPQQPWREPAAAPAKTHDTSTGHHDAEHASLLPQGGRAWPPASAPQHPASPYWSRLAEQRLPQRRPVPISLTDTVRSAEFEEQGAARPVLPPPPPPPRQAPVEARHLALPNGQATVPPAPPAPSIAPPQLRATIPLQPLATSWRDELRSTSPSQPRPSREPPVAPSAAAVVSVSALPPPDRGRRSPQVASLRRLLAPRSASPPSQPHAAAVLPAAPSTLTQSRWNAEPLQESSSSISSWIGAGGLVGDKGVTRPSTWDAAAYGAARAAVAVRALSPPSIPAAAASGGIFARPALPVAPAQVAIQAAVISADATVAASLPVRAAHISHGAAVRALQVSITPSPTIEAAGAAAQVRAGTPLAVLQAQAVSLASDSKTVQGSVDGAEAPAASVHLAALTIAQGSAVSLGLTGSPQIPPAPAAATAAAPISAPVRGVSAVLAAAAEAQAAWKQYVAAQSSVPSPPLAQPARPLDAQASELQKPTAQRPGRFSSKVVASAASESASSGATTGASELQQTFEVQPQKQQLGPHCSTHSLQVAVLSQSILAPEALPSARAPSGQDLAVVPDLPSKRRGSDSAPLQPQQQFGTVSRPVAPQRSLLLSQQPAELPAVTTTPRVLGLAQPAPAPPVVAAERRSTANPASTSDLGAHLHDPSPLSSVAAPPQVVHEPPAVTLPVPTPPAVENPAKMLANAEHHNAATAAAAAPTTTATREAPAAADPASSAPAAVPVDASKKGGGLSILQSPATRSNETGSPTAALPAASPLTSTPSVLRSNPASSPAVSSSARVSRRAGVAQLLLQHQQQEQAVEAALAAMAAKRAAAGGVAVTPGASPAVAIVPASIVAAPAAAVEMAATAPPQSTQLAAPPGAVQSVATVDTAAASALAGAKNAAQPTIVGASRQLPATRLRAAPPPLFTPSLAAAPAAASAVSSRTDSPPPVKIHDNSDDDDTASDWKAQPAQPPAPLPGFTRSRQVPMDDEDATRSFAAAAATDSAHGQQSAVLSGAAAKAERFRLAAEQLRQQQQGSPKQKSSSTSPTVASATVHERSLEQQQQHRDNWSPTASLALVLGASPVPSLTQQTRVPAASLLPQRQPQGASAIRVRIGDRPSDAGASGLGLLDSDDDDGGSSGLMRGQRSTPTPAASKPSPVTTGASPQRWGAPSSSPAPIRGRISTYSSGAAARKLKGGGVGTTSIAAPGSAPGAVWD